MTEFISIGPFCRTAIILKALNKRNCSYPFDCIFRSIKMVNHCIENEFEIFLDKSYIDLCFLVRCLFMKFSPS